MSQSHATGRRRYKLDFPELMRLCEQNYGRLLPLLRALGEADRGDFCLPGGEGRDVALSVRVLEKCRYTTVLRMEQEAVHALLPPSRITIRLYHDARLAEVTEALPSRRVRARHDYPNARMHQKDEKRQWNRFLADWLVHLQAHGGSRKGLPAGWAAASDTQR